MEKFIVFKVLTLQCVKVVLNVTSDVCNLLYILSQETCYFSHLLATSCVLCLQHFLFACNIPCFIIAISFPQLESQHKKRQLWVISPSKLVRRRMPQVTFDGGCGYLAALVKLPFTLNQVVPSQEGPQPPHLSALQPCMAREDRPKFKKSRCKAFVSANKKS